MIRPVSAVHYAGGAFGRWDKPPAASPALPPAIRQCAFQICVACAADIDQIQKVYDVMLEYQRALKASVDVILSHHLRL